MRRTSLWLPLLTLLFVSSPLFAHLSFNIAVDKQGNVYFLEIFKNSLLSVTATGEVSVLADLRVVEPEERLHSLTIGEKGDLYIGGYVRDKVWRLSSSGKVSSFEGQRDYAARNATIGGNNHSLTYWPRAKRVSLCSTTRRTRQVFEDEQQSTVYATRIMFGMVATIRQ